MEDRKGRLLAALPLPDGRFSHVFTHSFHLTPVEERFEIGPDGSLRLHELRYESLGVGMPEDAELGFRLEEGVFVLSMDRRFKEVPIMVSIVPGHGILAGGELLPFDRWVPPGGLLVLRGRAGANANE